MVHINFKTLQIFNFMSIGEMEVPLEGQGLILIEGIHVGQETKSNGSGKSSIIQAFKWVLTGDTDRGDSKDGLINRKSKSGMYVRLELVRGPDQITILRSRKHPEYGSCVKLYVNDVESDFKDSSDVDSFIYSELGVSAMTLNHQVILSQGMTNRFTLLDERSRSELIECMIERREFEESYSRCLSLVNTQKSRISAKESAFQVLTDQSRQKQEQLQRLSEKVEAMKNSPTTDTTETKKALEELQGLCRSLDISISEANAALGPMAQEIQSRNDILFGMQREVSGKENSLSAEQDMVSKVDKSIETNECALCGAKVDPETIKKRNDYDNRVKKIKSLQAETEVLRTNVALCREKLTHFQKKQSEMQAFLQSLNSDKNSKLSQINLLRQSIDSMSRDLDVNTTLLEEISQDLSRLKDQVAETEKDKKSIEEDLTYLEYWRKGFSPEGIRSRLKDRFYDRLNLYCQEYLSALYDDQISVQISSTSTLKSGAQKSKTSIDIQTPTGKSPLGLVSGGECRRIDLALQFALRSVSTQIGYSKFNLLWCDEIFDALDRDGIEKTLNLMKTFCEEGSVFVISQDPFVKSLIETRWCVKKKDGVSTLHID